MVPILNAVSAASASISLAADAPSGAASGGASPVSSSSATVPTPFANLITDAVGQVSKLEDQASAAVTGLMTGTGVDVHQAMIATEKASMGFELALAVRNKAVQAYQQVIGMQF
jgi:flagellar hook-basal body complex protein FliE